MNFISIYCQAEALVSAARAAGVHLTIETRSLMPLAMGHVEMVVDVRPTRGTAAPAPVADRKDLAGLLTLARAYGEQCERLGFFESGAEEIHAYASTLIGQTVRQTILDCDRRGTAGTWPLPSAPESLDPSWQRPAMEEVERDRMARVDRERLQARVAELETDAINYKMDATHLDAVLKARGQRITELLETVLAAQGAGEPVAWVDWRNLLSAEISRERGNPGDSHAWSESKNAIHDTPLYARPPAVEQDTLQFIAQSYERMRHDGRQFAAEQAEAAAKIADLTKCLAECEGALECCGHPIEQTEALKDAALEVLEAAKGLLTSMATRPSCQDGLVRNCKCRACASNRLRAAIASAEGAQS